MLTWTRHSTWSLTAAWQRHPDSRPRTKKCSLVLAYTSGTLLRVLESSWNLVFSPSGELSAPTNSKFSDPPLFCPWDYRIVWNDLKYFWKKPLLLYLWHFNLRKSNSSSMSPEYFKETSVVEFYILIQRKSRFNAVSYLKEISFDLLKISVRTLSSICLERL